MFQCSRLVRRALAACVLFLILTSGLRAQNSNSTGTIMWPNNPPVGIGTQLSPPNAPQNALHIHHDPNFSATLPAIIRLSDGTADTTHFYGALAFMPGSGYTYSNWSNLATQYDLVMHEHYGDLILANFNPWGGAIRMSTTPSTSTVPPATIPNDLERETILQNGNVGIDIPPDPGTGLCNPQDQIQIGGGVLAPILQTYAIPGLTMYGGNRFENMIRPDMQGGYYPLDRRYIAFNRYIDHTDTGATRFHRFQPMASSEIEFSQDNNGLLSFRTYPYDTTRGLNSFSRNLTLETSVYGLGYWAYDSAAAVPKHTLFEINPPGIKLGSVTRNTNGLAFFHTPVCITSDTASYMSIDFQNLPIRPNIGDDTTWDLVVNGAALFKEAFVNIDWPDYVFEPTYKVMPIDDFTSYLESHHHLPDIPPASAMQKTGVPLGQTAADLTKQVEEMAIYIGQLAKQNESLTADVKELKAEVSELKNAKEK